MSRLYEEIEVEGEKVSVKVDTASDFPLSLRKDVINKLKLPQHPTLKASLFREESGKPTMVQEPVWTADVKIRECKMTLPIVEATGDNLIGNILLQGLGADIDMSNDRMTTKYCPIGPWHIDGQRRVFELMGNFVLTGWCDSGRTGSLVDIGDSYE